MVGFMQRKIFSKIVVFLWVASLCLFLLSLAPSLHPFALFCAVISFGLGMLKILNRLADSSDAFLCRVIHWVHAMVFEAFGVVFMWCCRPFGYLWKLESRKGTKRPILLVHGYLHDSSAWIYHKWMLLRHGFGPIYMLNLKHPFLPMSEYVKKIEERASQIEKETRRKDLILIGHSMGGIISSLYATRSAKPGTVTDVITIGSPLGGTHVAKIALGSNGRQMRIGSKILAELREEIKASKTVRFYHIATKTDELVIPYTSEIVEGPLERLYVLNDIGHVTLLYSPRVAKKIISWISFSE